MRFLKNLSLRYKQSLVIMLTSSLALLLACAAFVAYDTVSFRQELTQNVSILAGVIGNNCAAAIDFNDPKSAEETLAALRANKDIVSACVYSQTGEVVAVYQRDPVASFIPPPAPRLVSETFAGDELHLVRAIKQHGVLIGMIFVASDLQELSARLERYINIVGVVFLASLLLAFLLSSRLQGLISGPILHLVKITRSVAVEKNYSVRAVKRSNDELGQLVDGFNEMLVQIQMRDTALQIARDNLEERVRERNADLAKANAALLESQSLYHSLVEHLPAGIFRKDQDGRYVFANARFCLIKGRKAEEILGKTPRDLEAYEAALEGNSPAELKLHARMAMQGADHHERIMRSGTSLEVAEEANVDGQKRYLHVVKSPVFDSGGKIVGTQGMLFDITEREMAEEALRESQALYLSLVDQMPAGVFRKDKAGRFVFVNSWFCRAKAMKPDQILGRTAQELSVSELQNPFPKWHPDLAAQGNLHHELIMQTGQTIEVEEQYASADGKAQHLRVVKSPVFGSDGKIMGTQGILFDMTASKEAEAELAYERHLLRVLLDSSPDAVYFKDLESRFIKVGTAHAKSVGMKDVNEIVGKTDFDFFADEHARPAFEDEQAIIRTGQPMIGKLEKEVLINGRVAWALTSKMPLHNKEGQIIGTFGISKDVTMMKETEAQLEQVHKQLLETSRQAGMAEVATGVLHNVGNVLNSVNVSSTLVVDHLKKSKLANLSKAAALLREHAADLGAFLTTDPRGRQLPDYLAQLANHLAGEQAAVLGELAGLQKNIEHIKDIVAMQQSYAKVSGVTETLKVSDLVEDALRMNASALERHKVEAIREFADVPPLTVDKHKVLQILINLIRNAKYACDESNRPDRQLKVRVANHQDRIRISIIDNGVGIPKENLVRIFNHGFTTRKEGHGFGLHSGALAARELGGALLVQSDGPGQGATFTLELPLKLSGGARG